MVDPDGGETGDPIYSGGSLGEVVVTATPIQRNDWGSNFMFQFLQRGDNWVNSFRSRNESQPYGERYYASMGLQHSVNENKYNGSASHHGDGGDVTNFLLGAGQSRTNSSSFVTSFDAVTATSNFLTAVTGRDVSVGSIIEIVKKSNVPENQLQKSIYTGRIIDDKTKDTISENSPNRSGSGTLLFRNPDGTITTVPKTSIKWPVH